jgi:exo-beta-1,3-glucanase (GH17 family)
MATATATFTAHTTVTDPAAVVWVDQNNNVIYTEFKTKSTPPPAASPQIMAAVPSPPPAVGAPVAAPAALSTAPEAAPAREAPNAAPVQASNNHEQPQAAAQAGNAQQPTIGGGGYGICYDLMAAAGSCRTYDQMKGELSSIKSQGFGLARTYDIGCDVGAFVKAAGEVGMRVMIGINSINNVDADIGKLIQLVNGNWGPVHTVNVGNEVVNQGRGSAGQVVAAINQARGKLQGAGYSGNVVAVDTFNQHISFPEICRASDYCAANAHAFFDPQTSPGSAGDFVLRAQQQIADKVGGKKVVITESGWPKSGAAEGASVPGVSQQQQAISSLKSAFASKPDELYIFQAYDATYKDPGARGVETSWGVF